MTANAASNHSKSITNLTRPAQFSEELWAVGTNQLQHALSCVGAVQTYISQSNTVINDILPYKTAIVKEVAASVDASDDPSSDIAVTLASMVLGIVNAVAIPLSDGAGLAAGVLASILGPAMASLPGSGTDAVHTEVHKLDDWLETQFKKSLTANPDYVNQILGTSDHLGDWGLLQTLGTLSSDGGPYQLQDNYINDAVSSATEPLKLWAYQALMPVKYQIWYLYQPALIGTHCDGLSQFPARSVVRRDAGHHKRRATLPGNCERPPFGSCFPHPRGVETA
jgi:hypothetical protein